MKFAIFLSILTLVVLIKYTVEGSGCGDTREKRSIIDSDSDSDCDCDCDSSGDISNDCVDDIVNVPGSNNNNVPVVEQWVSSVTNFSSESDGGYTASQIIGEPNDYGGSPHVWSQSKKFSTDIEWIIVQVQNPVCVTNVDVHEKLRSGHVTVIEALTTDCGFVTLWEAPNGVTQFFRSQIFSPTFQIAGCVCSDTIKITIEPNGIGRVYIDAVKVVGEDTCSS